MPKRPLSRVPAWFGASWSWVRAHPRIAAYAASLLVHLLLAPFVIHDWDGYVFITTTRDFLSGTTPYAAVESASPHIFVGDAVPVVNAWYAYPPVALLLFAPSYWVLTGLLGTAPWVERLAIKAPLIVGDLLLAFVIARYVAMVLGGHGQAWARARQAERWVLFNPFLIFISAAWGMFDAWIFVFLVASLIAIERGWLARAGVAYALSILVKPFPIFLAPLLVGYAAHRWGWRVWRAAAGAAAAGALVAVPFFASAPRGFLQQVVLNHAGRPPQGFSIASLPLAFGWFNAKWGTSLPTGIAPETISKVTFLALAVVLLLVWAQAGAISSAQRLVHLCLVAMTGSLLVSKVVNEQYFVMPTVLATLALALAPSRFYRNGLVAISAGGFVSALVLGWHFLTFLPLDVATWLFPFDPLESVPRLRVFLGWNDEQAFVYPTVIAILALLPALAMGARLVAPELAWPLRALASRPRPRLRVAAPALAGLVAALVIVPAVLVPASSRADDPRFDRVDPGLPLVGVHYELWWNNPWHDPRFKEGDWKKGVADEPLDGFYTMSAGKMAADFRLMKDSGVDLVVFGYAPYLYPKLAAVTRLAHDEGLVVAPMLETRSWVEDPAHRPRDVNGNALPAEFGLSLRDETRDALAEHLSRLVTEFGYQPSWWQREGAPVIFLDQTFLAFPDAVGTVRERMHATAMRIAAEDVADGRLQAVPDEAALDAAYPTSPEAMREATLEASLWRRAWLEEHMAFWQGVRDRVVERNGPVYLVAGDQWGLAHGALRGFPVALADTTVFDASTLFAPTTTWALGANDSYEAGFARWREDVTVSAQVARALGRPVFVTVWPGYDDRAIAMDPRVIAREHEGEATMARMWDVALGLAADVVLVGTWNDHQGGSGLEPTRARGDADVSLLRDYAARQHARPDSPAPDTLLVTNVVASSLSPHHPDPEWTFRLARNLQLAAEAVEGPRVAAIDLQAPLASRVNLSDYRIIVIEPGLGDMDAPASAAFVARLASALENGSRVLVAGSVVGPTLATFDPWTEPDVLEGHVTLLTPEGGHAMVVASDRARRHDIPADAQAYAWLEHEGVRLAAAWRAPIGDGWFAVTALKPAGDGDTPDPVAYRTLVSRAFDEVDA